LKILITGKNSYIANNIKKWLENFNFQVILCSVRGNINNISFTGYDVVIHCASIVHKKEKKVKKEYFFKINSDLAVEIANKCKEDGVKQFIFFSSMSVYGLNNGIITKNTKLNPVSIYGESKLDAENKLKKLQTNDFKIVIIRPPMVYGKNCPGNYKRLSKLAKITPVFPMVKNERSMIYIDNLCEFVRLIIENNSSGVFFPQNREHINTSKMVKAIAVANCRNICLIKGFQRIILFLNIGILNKIFGSLYYDFDMSNTFDNAYNIVDFIESINKTEEK